MVGTAVAQNPTILQGNYITNVFGQSNFVLNPNARTDVLNVTNATRSTTTPLVATSEFNLSLTSGTNATWTLRAFDQGMKGQNCEARFSYRGFATATTKAELVQNSLVVASLTLTPSTDPRIASINFPCGDITNLTTFRIAQTTANMTGTNEIGGIYVGLATNQANVAQAEMVVSAYATATQSLTASTYNTLVYGTELKDAYAEFDPATGVFTAKRAGDYQTTVTFSTFDSNSCTVNTNNALIIVKNNNLVDVGNSQVDKYTESTSSIQRSMTVTKIMTLAVGDTIRSAYYPCANTTKSSTSYLNNIQISRFPTSSELVVTPERQNTWGGVVYTGQNQSLFAGTAEPTAFTPFNNATWNQPTLLKGKAAVTTTNSGNDLGFSIPNLPVGQYKVEISGLLNTEATTTNGVIATCNFKIVETTTSTDVAKQANEVKVPALGLPTRDWTNAFSGVFNNTSVATRNFRLEASKFADNDASNNSGCQAYSNTGTTSALNTNITFLLTPLDQPSNSALYVQGPVLGAQTGATIGAGYVGETFSVIGTTDATINTTSGIFSTTLAQQSINPGVWMVIPSIHCKENSSFTGAIRFGARITANSGDNWSITTATTDGQVGLTIPNLTANGSEFSQDLSGLPMFLNVTSSTTYYLRSTSYNNLNSGSITCRGILKGVRLN
jgi:hypothetical protein